MSRSMASVLPFSETKAPEAPERLHRGALSLIDISVSTMANIGPAYSFFFGFGFLAVTAGVAALAEAIIVGRRSRSPCWATRFRSFPGRSLPPAGSSRS